jgi:hypothetical protein
MKYLALAIKTTGPNPYVHQVLEIVGIVDDLVGPIKALPRIHLHISYTTFIWDPDYMRQNWELLHTYLFGNKKQWSPLEIPRMVHDWTVKEGFDPLNRPIIVVGHPTDRAYLANLPGWSVMSDQFINPSTLYFNPNKHSKLPTASEILGQEMPNDAVSEAETAIALVRRKWAEDPAASHRVLTNAEPH